MRPSSPTTAVLAAVLTALVVVCGIALGERGAPRPRLAAAPTAAAPVPDPPGTPDARAGASGASDRASAVAVLRRWDERRRDAWASGDVRALTSLYLPGSRAGERDVQRLAAWVARGVRADLRTQVRSVRVERRRPARLVLQVTDRVVGAARSDGGAAALPRDGWSTHRVDLRQVGGSWQVAAVVAVRPARSGGSP